MEWLAPLLLAALFVVFGLSQKGRSSGGCASCSGDGECAGKANRGCEKPEAATPE